VRNICQRYLKEGLEGVLNEKSRPGKPAIFDGKQKAKITALACFKPPEGYGRWSFRLLADQAVELKLVDAISHMDVSRILKKNEVRAHLKRQWCLSKIDSQFIWHMENVLDIYEHPPYAADP
jgi:hypothetical protein